MNGVLGVINSCCHLSKFYYEGILFCGNGFWVIEDKARFSSCIFVLHSLLIAPEKGCLKVQLLLNEGYWQKLEVFSLHCEDWGELFQIFACPFEYMMSSYKFKVKCFFWVEVNYNGIEDSSDHSVLFHFLVYPYIWMLGSNDSSMKSNSKVFISIRIVNDYVRKYFSVAFLCFMCDRMPVNFYGQDFIR